MAERKAREERQPAKEIASGFLGFLSDLLTMEIR